MQELIQIIGYVSLFNAFLLFIMGIIIILIDICRWVSSKSVKTKISFRNSVILSIVIIVCFVSMSVTFIKQSDGWIIGTLLGGTTISLIFWAKLMDSKNISY